MPATCEHAITAPCSPSHKDAGLHTFCLKCNTFFGADGQPATAEPMAVRNNLAARLDAAAERHPDYADWNRHMANVFRNGGRIG